MSDIFFERASELTKLEHFTALALVGVIIANSKLAKPEIRQDKLAELAINQAKLALQKINEERT